MTQVPGDRTTGRSSGRPVRPAVGAALPLVRPGDEPVVEALEAQCRLGVLGTTAVEALAHSERFLPLVPEVGTVLDLGSGAGIPGLVVAWRCPALSVILLDARQRRTDQLSRLVGQLGLGGRVRVLTGRADVLARTSGLAGTVDAVVARSFGSPQAVLAAAAPFLRSGGRLVVSEPPHTPGRWPDDLLTLAGFVTDRDATVGFFSAHRV